MARLIVKSPYISVKKSRPDGYMKYIATRDRVLNFEGLARVLTILARGHLFHHPSGELAENPRDLLPYAREALCAWCSLPEGKAGRSAEDWRYPVSFPELHEKFPALVNEDGEGWFYHHVHQVVAFAKANPDLVSKSAKENCDKLRWGFNKAWENKLRQLQMPIFSPGTKGQWLLRFDDLLADALELGQLRQQRAISSPQLQEKIATTAPGCPTEVLETLIAYYAANRPEDANWVVLPVASFDAYFGSTTFCTVMRFWVCASFCSFYACWYIWAVWDEGGGFIWKVAV